MRLFFALELPQPTILAIDHWRQSQLPPMAKPVPAANFHLTLCFIGEMESRQLEQLCLKVDDLLTQDQLRCDPLLLDEIGYWPRPGILWLGPRSWPEGLTRLAARLSQLSHQAGSRHKSSRFRPHVTLSRRCQSPPAAPTTAPSFTLPFKDIVLYESLRQDRGVRYQPLFRWTLNGN
jgi:RNA 2',3'-cyclic 3'-phosphodiesterase